MPIDAGFDNAFALRLRLRAAERRIAELESGGAYAELKARAASLQREYEAKVKKLERELGGARRAHSKMTKCWFDVFGRVERERDEAVAHAMRSASRMEERALRAERQRDGLADALTAERRASREKDARIEELEGVVAKLTAQVNRDFENSSVPSSAQGPGRKRIPNTREATGRKPGAQPGHPHHPRRKPEPDRTVELPDPPEFKADPDLYRTDATVSKTVVSARIVVTAAEYVAAVWRRRSNGSRAHAPFPGGAKDEATYDGSVKAMAFLLTNECCMSAYKAKAFLKEASGGALDLSAGMIGALAREFSAKSAPEREAAVAALMSSPVMHADFTCANVGGDGKQVLILANPGAVVMLGRESKGHKGIEGSPLEGYVGCVEHDHDTTFYSYGTSHQECMQHNIRYLVGSVQNEPHLTWNSEMLGLLREMVHWRNSLDPDDPPGADDLAEAAAAFGRRYDAILGLAEREYEKSPPTKYYRDGYNLFRRLKDYRDSELRFLEHPEVDPDNSLCERLARVFKRKQRQAIAFRSFEFLCFVCYAISVVYNMRLAGKDVFAEVAAVFDRSLADIIDVPALSVAG